jgi:ABC-type multidrug transport system fused ATPase/permease subunit
MRTAALLHAGLRWSQRESYCRYIPNTADQPLHDPTKSFIDFTCIFPISQCFITLIIQAVAWMAIAIYLDNVMPNGSGKKRPLWYFLLPSYWFSSNTSSVRRLRKTDSMSSDGARRTSWPGAGPSETNLRASPALQQQQQHDLHVQVLEGESAAKTALGMSGGRAVTASIHEGDEDVAAEAARMHALLKHRVATMGSKAQGLAKASARVQAAAGDVSDAAVDLSVKFAVEVYGLSKVFKGAGCCALPGCGPRKGARKGTAHAAAAGGSAAAKKVAAAARRGGGDFWAIKDSWLGIEEGQLFCLLGPNGAGKTTTINCLTGERVQAVQLNHAMA